MAGTNPPFTQNPKQTKNPPWGRTTTKHGYGGDTNAQPAEPQDPQDPQDPVRLQPQVPGLGASNAPEGLCCLPGRMVMRFAPLPQGLRVTFGTLSTFECRNYAFCVFCVETRELDANKLDAKGGHFAVNATANPLRTLEGLGQEDGRGHGGVPAQCHRGVPSSR